MVSGCLWTHSPVVDDLTGDKKTYFNELINILNENALGTVPPVDQSLTRLNKVHKHGLIMGSAIGGLQLKHLANRRALDLVKGNYIETRVLQEINMTVSDFLTLDKIACAQF